jgi:hypothetical protein
MISKETLKMTAFLVFLSILLTGIMHITFYAFGKNLENFYTMYFIMPIAILLITSFAVFVIEPIADWWFDE